MPEGVAVCGMSKRSAAQHNTAVTERNTAIPDSRYSEACVCANADVADHGRGGCASEGGGGVAWEGVGQWKWWAIETGE
eukprot:3896089-Alexandrium_andersonii.AAC.1